MAFSFQPLNARDDSLDEVWPWFGEGQLKRGSELLTGATGRMERPCRYRWTRSQGSDWQDPVAISLLHLRRGRRPLELDVEDGIGTVVEDDDGHVELLARHRPQRLDGVHGGPVSLQRKDRTLGAGHRRANGDREPCPIAPPVRVSTSCRGAPRVWVASVRPEVWASWK